MNNEPTTNKTDWKKSNAFWLILVSLFLILLSAFLIFLFIRNKKKKKAANEFLERDSVVTEGAIQNAKKSNESLYQDASVIKDTFIQNGVSEKDAQYWSCVSAHETGGYTSELYHDNHNLFGMKYAGQARSIGEKNGYADYRTYEDSILDIVKWIDLNGFSNAHDSIRKFASEMKSKGYYEDSLFNYTNALLKWNKQLYNS